MNESAIPERWASRKGGSAEEQREEHIMSSLRRSLHYALEEGLLEMSVDPITEEAVFWATPLGEKVLEMNA